MLDLIKDSSSVIEGLKYQLPEIDALCRKITDQLMAGNKILTAGNGGSAAAALHLAEELTGKYDRSDRRALPAICLAADTTAITCIANDWDFASVFSRQVEAYCKPGDVLVVFSSSGNSENIVRACESMKKYDGISLALLGRGGGRVQQIADLSLVVNSKRTASIQEAHEVILHLILEHIERVI
jgi:D-sedoheptulose 7-phosphate isomerase